MKKVSEFNACRASVRREAAAAKPQPLSFADATSSTRPALDDVIECMYFRAPKRNLRKGYMRVGYGIYAIPLAYWWTLFPRQQLLVLRSDEVLPLNNPRDFARLAEAAAAPADAPKQNQHGAAAIQKEREQRAV